MRIRHLLLGTLVAASCFSTATTVLFNPDAKQPVVLHVKDVLLVKLNTVSDGGYAWSYLIKSDGHLRLISQTMESAAQPDKKHPIVGAPKITVFKFSAEKRGTDKIAFAYGRPWEMKKGVSPTQTLPIRILVK
jgi:predicted secreted protein